MANSTFWDWAMGFVAMQAVGILSVSMIMLRIGQTLLARFTDSIERRLDERFEVQETQRAERSRHWDSRFDEFGRQVRQIEKEQADIRLLIAKEYVHKNDAIREQTVVQAKLDALYARVEMVAHVVARLDQRGSND